MKYSYISRIIEWLKYLRQFKHENSTFWSWLYYMTRQTLLTSGKTVCRNLKGERAWRFYFIVLFGLIISAAISFVYEGAHLLLLSATVLTVVLISPASGILAVIIGTLLASLDAQIGTRIFSLLFWVFLFLIYLGVTRIRINFGGWGLSRAHERAIFADGDVASGDFSAQIEKTNGRLSFCIGFFTVLELLSALAILALNFNLYQEESAIMAIISTSMGYLPLVIPYLIVGTVIKKAVDYDNANTVMMDESPIQGKHNIAFLFFTSLLTTIGAFIISFILTFLAGMLFIDALLYTGIPALFNIVSMIVLAPLWGWLIGLRMVKGIKN